MTLRQSIYKFAHRIASQFIGVVLCARRDAMAATRHSSHQFFVNYILFWKFNNGDRKSFAGNHGYVIMSYIVCAVAFGRCSQNSLISTSIRRCRFFFCGNKKLKYSWSTLKSSNQQQQRQQAWKSIGRHLLNRISSNFIACIYNWQQQSNIRRDTMCRRPTGRPEHGKLCVNINFVAKITCNYRCRHIGGDTTVYGGMLEVTATTACVRFNH